MNLTFGEQLLLLLKRKNMTIQEFSELLEARTGVPCPAESLKQQLKKDNFLEQDMSILAAALDRQVIISLEPVSTGEPLGDFSLFSNYRPVDNSIQMKTEPIPEKAADSPEKAEEASSPADISENEEVDVSAADISEKTEEIGSLSDSPEKTEETSSPADISENEEVDVSVADISEKADEIGTLSDSPEKTEETSSPADSPEKAEEVVSASDTGSRQRTADASPEDIIPDETEASIPDTSQQPLSEQDKIIRQVTQSLKEAALRKSKGGPEAQNAADISLSSDSINPYTQEEYLNNTVRRHPDQDRYIQVYDVSEHRWIDVPENYFQKFQYVKRKIMGRDYTPPIYI